MSTTTTKKALRIAIVAAPLLYFMAAGIELHHILGWAVTDLQKLHADLVWLSVGKWFSDMSRWQTVTWIASVFLVLYALVKAVTIVRAYEHNHEDGNYANVFKALATGCGLAVFAPYRLTQAMTWTRDETTLATGVYVRAQTLKNSFLYNDTLMRINIAIGLDSLGFNSLSDYSATYIYSVMRAKGMTLKVDETILDDVDQLTSSNDNEISE
ncbi:hypothetical protein [Vibrio sp. Hal054]|uniref:hypothetical protein n=1 Tax=Vibrio sp. Hal054 TaxID=3035158 RepID=UPI00301DF5CE